MINNSTIDFYPLSAILPKILNIAQLIIYYFCCKRFTYSFIEKLDAISYETYDEDFIIALVKAKKFKVIM